MFCSSDYLVSNNHLPEMFSSLNLNPSNSWVKFGQSFPWDAVEEACLRTHLGLKASSAAVSPRIMLGTLIIKHWYAISDEQVTEEIALNPYLQAFLGLTEYHCECPFAPGSIEEFQRYFSPELLVWVNHLNDELET